MLKITACILALVACIVFLDRQAVRTITNTAVQNNYNLEHDMQTLSLDWNAGGHQHCKITRHLKIYKTQTCYVKYGRSDQTFSYLFTPPRPFIWGADGILGLPTFGTEADSSFRFSVPFRHSVAFIIYADGKVEKVEHRAPENEVEPTQIIRTDFGFSQCLSRTGCI